MAAAGCTFSCCAYAFPVHSWLQRPSLLLSHKHNHHHHHHHHNVKASSSLYSSIKPYLKELPQIPRIILDDVPKLMKVASANLLDAVVHFTFEITDQELLPSQSNVAPVEEIGEAVAVTATQGRIPDDFSEGVYIRNGGNPPFGALKSAKSLLGVSHDLWVEGEGMVHSLYFKKDSNDNWNILYNNKYVQTKTLKMEMERNERSFLPATEGDTIAVMAAYLLNSLRFGTVNKELSNTNVFEHSGKFYSIAENHMPQEIDILTLETLGNWDLINQTWNRTFTSHPKKAPGTGELLISGIQPIKPYLLLGVISADGERIIHKVDLKLNRCSLCHEIGITERYNVILDFPLTLDLNRLVSGGPIFLNESKGYARIGVMPRYGDADSVKWFEVEPCVVFHIVNCFEDEDEVVVIGCKSRASIIPGPEFGFDKFEWFSRAFKPLNLVDENDENSIDASLFTRAHEWRLNMRTGEVKTRNLTGNDFSVDFPMINQSFVGVKNKYGYAQAVDGIASSDSGFPKFGGLAKIYLDEKEVENSTGNEIAKVEHHKFPEKTFCTGAAFVPKHGGLEEDDGWVISFVHNEETNKSQAYIVDAKKFCSEPVAVIGIPTRVPYGFHGAFHITDELQNKI